MRTPNLTTRVLRWRLIGLALAVVMTGCTAGTPPPPEGGTSAGSRSGIPTRSTGSGSTGGSPTSATDAPTSRPTGIPVSGRWPGATRLRPGETPPQFVVVSWDGAGATDELFAHYRALARQLSGSMTFFLTGIYAVPAEKRSVYQPPRRAPGASDIGFLSRTSVRATMQQVALAATEGDEIGTHFNGHFCGAGGIGSWTPADWDSEIEQAITLVTDWRTTSDSADLPELPFDYLSELVGGRTPCLEGRAALLQADHLRTWRYDSSGTTRQVWPGKLAGTGLWDLSMDLLPFPGHFFEVLAMDYSFMANQSGNSTRDATRYAQWQAETLAAYRAGFQRAYAGNRAPLIVGNHFESWNGGIYLAALDQALAEMATQPDVHFVSMLQLCDWLDAQDPAVLARLQALPVGTAPAGGWAALVS